MRIQHKIVKVPDYITDVESYLNTLGLVGWEFQHLYNGQAFLISGSTGASITVTGSVIPVGTVSSSAQVKSLLPINSVSSSAQVTAFLPIGTVSSSVQVNTGSFTGSFAGAGSLLGTSSWASNAVSAVSASAATTITFVPATASFATTSSYITFSNVANKPSGVVSSSAQINTGSFTGSFNGAVTSLGLVLPTAVPAVNVTGSAYFSSGFLYIWNGLKYVSSSFV
jgi:hypothetical protein